MRGTITFDHHGQHAWLHFAFRLAIVLLLIFLILVLSEKVVGQTQKAALTQAEIFETEQLLNNLGYWTGPIDGVTRKINGLRISSLGALYYPSYIVNGIAIHGSPSVLPYQPATAASASLCSRQKN